MLKKGKYYSEYRNKFGHCIARQKVGKFFYCIASNPKNPIDCPFVTNEQIGIKKQNYKDKNELYWYSGCSFKTESEYND